MQLLASIPSPSQGSVHLGPLPLRGYALMIILGVVVAVWLAERRWAARGGASGTAVDLAVWAVPFGLVGARLYHVITDHQLYFGHGRHPIDALKVWNGGLSIWGAIACGALGAYLGCRRRGISLRTFADAAAPGIALAQAIARWGNWFNQELYGRPTKLPWAVEIDPAHRPAATPDIATYHPTFLYESLWCVGVAVLVIWAEKRFRLAYGRTFALYVAAYTVGRAWIEWLRVDPAHHVLGLRLNDWTSLVVFLAAAAYLYLYRDRTEIPEGALGTAVQDGGSGEAPADEQEPAEQDDSAAGEAGATAAAGAEASGTKTDGAEDDGGDTAPAPEGAKAEKTGKPEKNDEGATAGAAVTDSDAEDAASDAGPPEDGEVAAGADGAEAGKSGEVDEADEASDAETSENGEPGTAETGAGDGTDPDTGRGERDDVDEQDAERSGAPRSR